MKRLLWAPLAAVLLAAAAAPALAGYIGNVRLTHPTHSYLPNGTRATVDFDYKITNPAGARFRIEPYYGGAPVADYSWSGSALYPAGTGSMQNWFQFSSGSHLVDQYRVRMVTPDWNTTLLEICLPAVYRYGDHGIYNLAFSHTMPSCLDNAEQLAVTFDYASTEAGGVRISARPYTNGSLTPGYSGAGVPLLPASGSADQWFTFNAGSVHVDQVRFRMTNADQTAVLLEFFVAVDFDWAPSGFANIAFSPEAPCAMSDGRQLDIEFDYHTDYAGDVYLIATPYFEGESVSGYCSPGTGMFPPGANHHARWINFHDQEAEVDEVRLFMWHSSPAVILAEKSLPVRYHWGPHAVFNQAYTPASPAVLDYSEHVDVTFDYTTEEAGGVRIMNMPYVSELGESTVGTNGLPALPCCAGSSGGFFTVVSGGHTVERVGYWVYDLASTALWHWFLPVHYVFGEPAILTAAPPTPELPAAALAGPATLEPIYPNPFNPVTNIPVTMAAAAPARLRVYDLRGRLVRTLVDGPLPAGRTEIAFAAGDLASGVYFCALEVAGTRQTRRMVLMK